MPSNYMDGKVIKSAITATTDDEKIDVRGYKEIAIQVKWGTCTGSDNGTPHIDLETSNDGENWTSVKAIATSSDAHAATLSGLNYQIYIPDYATAGDGGYGRYIRFTFTASGTFSVSYTVYYELKA